MLVSAVPGMLIGLAVAVTILRIAPVTLRAGDVLDRLDTDRVTRGPSIDIAARRSARVGAWLATRMPDLPGFTAPTKALDLLEITAPDFYFRKALLAVTGLIAPAVLAALMSLIVGDVVAFPLLLSPFAAACFWVLPDVQVRGLAAARRREFTRFVTSYLDLVAVALLGNTTADAAMHAAADVSDAWVFDRIRREYQIADAARVSKWHALERLSDTVEVPALGELARVMRQSEAHVSIRDQLRAAAEKLRAQVVADDAVAAQRISAQMQAPIVLTILPVMALILIPTALQSASTF